MFLRLQLTSENTQCLLTDRTSKVSCINDTQNYLSVWMVHLECALMPLCKLLKCQLPSPVLRPCPSLQGCAYAHTSLSWSLYPFHQSASPQKYPVLPVLLKWLERSVWIYSVHRVPTSCWGVEEEAGSST